MGSKVLLEGNRKMKTEFRKKLNELTEKECYLIARINSEQDSETKEILKSEFFQVRKLKMEVLEKSKN